MSGTSLDGIDMSVLKTNGINIIEFGPNYFTKFSKELYEKLIFTLTLKDELSLHLSNSPDIWNLLNIFFEYPMPIDDWSWIFFILDSLGLGTSFGCGKSYPGFRTL